MDTRDVTGEAVSGIGRGLRPLALGAMVAVVAGGILLGDWRRTLAAAAAADPLAIGLAVMAVTGSTVAKGIAWRTLVRGLPQGSAARASDTTGALLVCGLVNSVTVGNVGEVAKVAATRLRLRRRGAEATWSGLIGSALCERLASIAGLGVFALGVGLFAGGPPALWGSLAALGALAAAAMLIFGVRSPCPPCAGPAAPRLAGRARRWLADTSRAAHGCNRRLGRRGAVASLTVTAIGQWVLVWAATMAVLIGFGLGDLGWSAAAIVTLAAVSANAIPLNFAGIGVAQLGPLAALVGLYGVDPAVALAVAVAIRLIETASNVVFGLPFALMLLGPRPRVPWPAAPHLARLPIPRTAGGVDQGP